MKARFILFLRGEVFYSEYTVTRKQHSLQTEDENEATVLLSAKNESFRQPVLNIHLARAYLTVSDPAMDSRPWKAVMHQMRSRGKVSTQLISVWFDMTSTLHENLSFGKTPKRLVDNLFSFEEKIFALFSKKL